MSYPEAVLLSARMGSSRLRGKSMMPLGGMPLAVFCFRRLETSKTPTIFLTSDRIENDVLEESMRQAGAETFRGSDNDLVARYFDAAEKFQVNQIIRATGDCPFISAELLDFCMIQVRNYPGFDLYTTKGSFPIGLDFEIFSFETLKRIHLNENLTDEEREHLTLYFYRHPDKFKIKKLDFLDLAFNSEVRYTVDYEDDYQFAKKIVDHLGTHEFSISELLSLGGMK